MTANAHEEGRPPVGAGRDLPRMIAMMVLFFLVVCAVGILRPIKNALALDGLGDTDFYKVYLVSAVVILFVPVYNRVADRVSWRWLIPAVSLFFALHLLVFRLLYREGSTAFGLAFYGWYDLFAAALVTQFFIATQLFFDARMARRAYPLVIAGGSIGATLGGGVTAFFAQRVGTPDLMLVAAALIAVFSVGMPFVWAVDRTGQPRRRSHAPLALMSTGELRSLLAHPQVRLIAGMVLVTILVKQLVDYQFNTFSKEVFESRDAISAFQGRFNAATQWLPLVVLAALQPLLRRWGVGLAVMLLPVAMLLTNAGLVLFWGLGMVIAAKGAETSLRYSAERAGREILYVPVPDAIKLRAKAYIDVAIEKGIGKVASAALIFLLLQVMSYRSIALVSTALSLLLLAMAVRVKAEYIRSLGRS
ncbi:MAG: Npt1/Npt2 family nucleotide transporter, partial [Longimicrobiales bacterium]